MTTLTNFVDGGVMKIIAESPTPEMYQSGLEIDCQCARCGSICGWQTCEICNGDGLAYKGMDQACGECHGHCGYQCCLSDYDWCMANPMEGRENVRRGQVEWFTVKEPA